ncbi:MAG: hypothetical protein AAF797_16080 [Planctomycetota bacterium]
MTLATPRNPLSIQFIILTMILIGLLLVATFGLLGLAALRRRRRRREAAQERGLQRTRQPAATDVWAVAGQRVQADCDEASPATAADTIHDELTDLGFSEEDAADLEALMSEAGPSGPTSDPIPDEEIPFGDPDDSDEGDDAELPYDDGYPNDEDDDEDEDEEDDDDRWWQRGEPPPY